MPYYTKGTPATANTLARAENVDAELVTIVAAFDKIPEQLSLEQDRAAFATDTGAADAYVVAMPATLLAYTTGLSVRMKAVNANTGASTINVDGLGVKTITRFNGDALLAGDIPADSVLEFYYDGTNFQLAGGPATITNAVIGPASSTDNAVMRFNGTTGKAAQDSVVTVSDTGAIAGVSSIAVSGNVDGRDVSADGTKLDGIETAATADQTDAEIKTAYEANANTNEFSDAEQTKLAGIATGAEVNPAVVPQAEAEAGTATTERVWTAERVKQAIAALESSVAQATQAAIEAETNEDTYIPPDLNKHGPGFAKGRVKADFAGTILDSNNVTSITDGGVGLLTVTWATDFSSADYEVVGTTLGADARTVTCSSQAAGSANFEARDAGGVLADHTNWFIVAHGDQA